MTNTEMTRAAIIENIIEYFKENEDIFNDCIEELDGYNGYLGDDRYYGMYEIDEFYSDTDASELLARAFYGYDEDSYTTNSYGHREYDAFNPNRDYFRYNGYGNLVSADYKDYSAHLDNYAVESMIENRDKISTIERTPELEELFNLYDECDE